MTCALVACTLICSMPPCCLPLGLYVCHCQRSALRGADACCCCLALTHVQCTGNRQDVCTAFLQALWATLLLIMTACERVVLTAGCLLQDVIAGRKTSKVPMQCFTIFSCDRCFAGCLPSIQTLQVITHIISGFLAFSGCLLSTQALQLIAHIISGLEPIVRCQLHGTSAQLIGHSSNHLDLDPGSCAVMCRMNLGLIKDLNSQAAICQSLLLEQCRAQPLTQFSCLFWKFWLSYW